MSDTLTQKPIQRKVAIAALRNAITPGILLSLVDVKTGSSTVKRQVVVLAPMLRNGQATIENITQLVSEASGYKLSNSTGGIILTCSPYALIEDLNGDLYGDKTENYMRYVIANK